MNSFYGNVFLGDDKLLLKNITEGGRTNDVLTRVSDNTGILNSGIDWRTPRYVPTGGDPGQILTLTENGYSWRNAPSGLPSGGSNGLILGYNNGNPSWIDPPTELPSGGSKGQVLLKNSSNNPAWGYYPNPVINTSYLYKADNVLDAINDLEGENYPDLDVLQEKFGDYIIAKREILLNYINTQNQPSLAIDWGYLELPFSTSNIKFRLAISCNNIFSTDTFIRNSEWVKQTSFQSNSMDLMISPELLLFYPTGYEKQVQQQGDSKLFKIPKLDIELAEGIKNIGSSENTNKRESGWKYCVKIDENNTINYQIKPFIYNFWPSGGYALFNLGFFQPKNNNQNATTSLEINPLQISFSLFKYKDY